MGGVSNLNVKVRVRNFLFFILPRYPFAQSLSLLMFIAERAHKDLNPPFPPNAIYAFVFLLFACGIGMSIYSVRPHCALLASLILMSTGIVIYFNQSLEYRYWVKIRMAHGLLGASCAMLTFSFFVFNKPRPQTLRKIMEILISLYCAIQCYILLKSIEDRNAFTTFIPFQNTTLFAYLLILATTSFCFLFGLHVFDFNIVLSILLVLKLFLIDVRISYWHQRRGLDYWNQVRLIIDNSTFILGTLLYMTCFKRSDPEIKLAVNDPETKVHAKSN